MANHSKYKPEFCEMLVKHMSEGYTFGSFAAVAKVNRDTLFQWAKTHPEFQDAKSLGESELLFFDEKLLKGIIIGKIAGANITGLIFKFKNCHGWRDRQRDEADVIVKNEIKVDQVDIEERIKRLKSRK